MQTLEVVSRLYPDILSGAKTSTIRWRELRISPGPLVFVDQGDPARRVEVVVWDVRDLPLRDAAADLGRASEWPDDVLLAGMREHYPEITLDDVVQIVWFERRPG